VLCVCRNYTADLVSEAHGLCALLCARRQRRPCPVYWRMTLTTSAGRRSSAARDTLSVGKMHLPCLRMQKTAMMSRHKNICCHPRRLFNAFENGPADVHMKIFMLGWGGNSGYCICVREREKERDWLSESNCCRWNLNDAPALELDEIRTALFLMPHRLMWGTYLLSRVLMRRWNYMYGEHLFLTRLLVTFAFENFSKANARYENDWLAAGFLCYSFFFHISYMHSLNNTKFH
jgi:hypothetical protein